MNNLLEKSRGLFLAGVLVALWFATQLFGAFLGYAVFGNAMAPLMLISHGLAVCVLWALLARARAKHVRAAPAAVIRGTVQARDVLLLGSLMLVGYAAHQAYVIAVGQPQEDYMRKVMALSPDQLAIVVATAALIVPISEELAFRHVLPGLPAEPAPRLDAFSAIRVGLAILVFACLHLQYHFLSTFVLLMWVASLCMLARWKTGGMVLPVALHGFASLLALAFNLLY